MAPSSTRCASTSASRRRRMAAARRVSAGAARCGSTASPASRASRPSRGLPVGPSRHSRVSMTPTGGLARSAPTAGASAASARQGSSCASPPSPSPPRPRSARPSSPICAAAPAGTPSSTPFCLLQMARRCVWGRQVRGCGPVWRVGWGRTLDLTSRSVGAGSPTTPHRPVRSSPFSTPVANGWSASRWRRRAR